MDAFEETDLDFKTIDLDRQRIDLDLYPNLVLTWALICRNLLFGYPGLAVHPAHRIKGFGSEVEMQTIASLFIASIGAFLLTVGIGSADCISECFGNGAGMQCTSCDSPKDGESRMATLFE